MVFKFGQKCSEQIQTQAERCLGESTKIDQVVIKKQPRCYHISYTALIFLIIGLVLVILCRRFVKDLLEWLQNLDEWARVLLFVIMFTVVSFPVTWGYILLNVAAGYLYGFLLGYFVVIVSVLCGLWTAFIVCRRYLRDFVRSKLESDNLKAIMRVVEGKRGFKVIALTRLTPVPFGLQNGLFAVTNVSTPKYVISSTVGLLPTQALNAYMGSTFRSLEDIVQDQSGGYIILFVQFIISVLLMAYVIRRARKELNKTCDEVEEAIEENGHVQTAMHEEFKLSRVKNFVRDFDIEAQSQGKSLIESKVKKGHQRSKSASAILIAITDMTSKAPQTP
ncbi:transmembrane protein 64-like [Montipora capricornis]|uniref:transmembrane protein 64-like n=1 Tax=Montipora capricornis TaxID=246305 RepID=UPI0035F1C20B